MTTAPWLLYGAYGFTGRLIAHEAVAHGLTPVLAGRDAVRTRAVAESLDLPFRVFPLDPEGGVRDRIGDMGLVVHAAGPYSRTWRPMVRACLAERTDYVDVTGEIRVLEAIHGLGGRARDRGVVLLPGAGMDVAPSDAAAVRVTRRAPGATHLDLAFRATGPPSRGTLRGILEGLAGPGAVRRDGRIVPVPHGSIRRTIPFSGGARDAVVVPWGDVSTAFHSTGVPNIRVFVPLGRAPVVALKGARQLLRVGWVRRMLDRAAARWITGPGERELREGSTHIWAEARAGDRTRARIEVRIPNGYTFTASCVVEVVRRMREPRLRPDPGTHTPSTAFGPGLIDDLPGVEWIG